MHSQYVRSDVEGDLIQINDSPTEYAKRLPLDVAWHSFDFDALSDWLGEYVDSISQHLDDDTLMIRYVSGVQPLDLAQLRAILQPDQPLGAWRLAVFGVAVAQALMECHTAQLPQMVMHPERIALLSKRFVVMPSMSGLLPPYSQLRSNQAAGWLHYVAPEVLRTRGHDLEVLYQADVYSLGCLLWAVAHSDWEPDLSGDQWWLAEYRVNFPAAMPETHGDWPTPLEIFRATIMRMCAPFPESRVTLNEAIHQLHGILGQMNPSLVITNLMAQSRLEEAAELVAILEDRQIQVYFPYPPADLHALKANLALAQPQPAYADAIDQIRRALQHEPHSVDLLKLQARTYQQYATHPQHYQLAAGAYAEAARQSGWDQDLLNTWLEMLRQVERLEDQMALLSRIPSEHRPAGASIIVARVLLQNNQTARAWDEIVRFFRATRFDNEAYQVAREIGAKMDPLALLNWKAHYPGADTLDILLSVVWEANGNMHMAKQHFDKALAG